MNKFKYQSLIKAILIFSGLSFSSEPSQAMFFKESNQIGESPREHYRKIHNNIASRYRYDHRFINPHVSDRGPDKDSSGKFASRSTHLKEKEAKNLEEINAFGKKIVDGLGSIADNLIEKGVTGQNMQNILTQSKNEVTNSLKNFFK